MAKQAGALPFTGSIGGVTGYKRNGKYCLREKSGPSREQVLTSEKFERTLENAKEFRRTTKAGKLVRGCLHNLTKGMKLANNQISARLNGLLSKIVKSDPMSDRGERTVSKGQLEWLEDFAFRKEQAFCSVFMVCPASTMDTDTGYMKVEIRPFDPQQRIKAPEVATHFKVVVNGAAIDFEKERTNWNYKQTGYISLATFMEETILLEQTLKPRPGQTLLQAIGIVLYRQGEDGHFERVPGGVMRILQVSEPYSLLPQVVDRVYHGSFNSLKTYGDEGNEQDNQSGPDKHPGTDVNAVGKSFQPVVHTIPGHRRRDEQGDHHQYSGIAYCRMSFL